MRCAHNPAPKGRMAFGLGRAPLGPTNTMTSRRDIQKTAKITRLATPKKHYGFTGEGLDFIINYDIKYRMGRDAEESE